MAADLMNKFVAVIRDSQLLIFCMYSLDKAIDTFCGTKQVLTFIKKIFEISIKFDLVN